MPMSTLSIDDTLHVAKLANLKLTELEVEKFAPQLSSIVTYIEELSECDTENTEPTSQVTGLVDVFRRDEIDVTHQLTNEEALSGTENTHNGYIVAPYVFEENS